MSAAGHVSVSGIGIHSGLVATVTLSRHDGGIHFRHGRSEIAATVGNVVSTERTTTLGVGGAGGLAARVGMVEHLLAALRVAGFFGGVLIDCDRDELPILDGSAQPWFEVLPELGPPPPAPPPLQLTKRVEVRRGASKAVAEPGTESLDCAIDFDHPAIGAQRWSGGNGRYQELLGARTFGLLAEAEYLKSRGLALGAGLEHAIVFADEGPLRPLRFPDEPVRHKALDALGDLALLGRPLAARVTIERGSHSLHRLLMSAIVASTAEEDVAVPRS